MLNSIWVSFGSNEIFQNIWFVAAVWMGLALVASLVSIWAGISVALIEILVGVFAGNFLHLTVSNEWINFLPLLGSGVLTFLAGAEIDPRSLKANLRASVLIGVISFTAPFGIVWLFAQFVLGWPLHQAQIAGIALSTTSVAVVYAVMIGGFVVVMCVVLWFMPRWTKSIIVRLGATRVSEPEVKFLFFVLFFLGGLATTAKSEAVLPAYLVGLVVAGVFLRDKTLVHRIRSIAFAMFTPFYFIKAGLYVSLPALWPALAIVAGLLLLKMLTKIAGVWPLARLHYMNRHQAAYTTLLMATGLTFGTISALFGLQNKIIDQRQYTILVTVVILSAFVPTLFAQKFLQPTKDAMHAWGRLYRRRLGILSSLEDSEEINRAIDQAEQKPSSQERDYNPPGG